MERKPLMEYVLNEDTGMYEYSLVGLEDAATYDAEPQPQPEIDDETVDVF